MIWKWIDADATSQRRSICWLHGPAGAGKSAIAQTVSEICAERGQLAASFFFSRQTPGRDTIARLFTTIAYQIAISIPDKRQKLMKVLHDNPLIGDKAISIQIKKLIVDLYTPEPRTASAPVPPSLVVIDGLDECNNNTDQSRIISHILDLVHLHRLPIRFLVISRPEPHIRHSFNDSGMRSYLTTLSLYGDCQAQNDVCVFLRSGFAKIRESERHSDTMKFISEPWPSDDVIQVLAERSGGYFIYASTVLKYVDEEYFSCVDRLREILGPAESTSTTFGELDKLYSQVLAICPNTNLLRRILGCLLLPSKATMKGLDDRRITTYELEAILSLQPGEVMLTLRGLHSLILTGRYTRFPNDGHIESIHASFTDFLFDQGRAGKYFIDPQICQDDLVRTSLTVIRNWSHRKTDCLR